MKLLMRALMLCSALLLLRVTPGHIEKAWGAEYPGATGSSPTQNQPSANPGIWLLDIYRDYISPVKGYECPSVPPCSSYAVQVFRKHGFFVGWMMMVDRLIHEGREERSVSPLIYWNGKWKLYDPVENNDFWWYQPGEKRKE
jgi:Putative membrane protein insertion efficiency factor